MHVKSWMVIFACAGLMLAQQVTIHSDVPLVVIPTTVTDQKGHFITGLSEADFLVFDERKPKHVHVDTIDSGLVPVALVVVVQCSDISGSALAKIRKTGSMMTGALAGEQGEVAVLAFDHEVRVLQNFTRDADRVTDAFDELRPGSGNGRLIDAVDTGLALLAERPGNGRRILLTISESRDRGSKTKLTDTVLRAQRENVTIYTATYSAFATPFTAKSEDQPPAGGTNLFAIFTEPARLAKKNAAEAFANSTGGKHFSFLTQKALEQGMMKTGKEIHNQYLLSFTPEPASDSEFRQLEVKVKGHPDAVIRHRPGYWAAAAKR